MSFITNHCLILFAIGCTYDNNVLNYYKMIFYMINYSEYELYIHYSHFYSTVQRLSIYPIQPILKIKMKITCLKIFFFPKLNCKKVNCIGTHNIGQIF